MPLTAHRLSEQPLIHAGLDDRIGNNINGPSLVRSPSWVKHPLGRYLLYFADHKGKYVRLAYADQIEGPWTIHTPGCLELSRSLFPERLPKTGSAPDWVKIDSQWYYPHIASPDVHVDEDRQEIWMYFHGMLENGEQMTRLATSRDGLSFEVRPDLLGPPYLRVFRHGGWCYAIALPNVILRSPDGQTTFEPGAALLPPATRHTAVLVADNTLHVFWSEIGDAPERIYHGTIDLAAGWQNWKLSGRSEVLRPQFAWEGASEALAPSAAGAVDILANQLRDPCVFQDGAETYLLYSAGGESAIGAATLEGL